MTLLEKYIYVLTALRRGLIYAIFIFTVLDIIIFYAAKNAKIRLKSKYFELNAKYGFRRSTFWKLILALSVAYLLANPPVRVLGPIFVAIIYVITVIKLAIDYMIVIFKKK